MMKPFTYRIRKEWQKMFQGKEEKVNEEKIPSEGVTETGEIPETEATKEAQVFEVTSEMLQKMAEGMERAKEAEARAMRLQADFDNFRKRNLREKEDLSNYASQKIITSLLPVLDDFERAIQAAQSNMELHESYLTGLDMIYRQLWAVLQKEGLEEIVALGQLFDPSVHEAVMTCLATDEKEDNTVAQVLRKGYKMKEKVIRAVLVQVAHK
jgi:molecular chaperone GrpE